MHQETPCTVDSQGYVLSIRAWLSTGPCNLVGRLSTWLAEHRTFVTMLAVVVVPIVRLHQFVSVVRVCGWSGSLWGREAVTLPGQDVEIVLVAAEKRKT